MGRSQRIFKKIKKNPPIRHAVNFANSYTTEQIPEVSESMEAGPSQLETPRSRQPSPTPSISPSPSSSSERKLNVSMLEYDNYASTHVYDIVDLNKLNDVIRSMACCKNCGEDISLEPYSRVGIAVSISLKCTKCSNKAAFRNCERIERKISEGKVLKAYSLNLRLVYGMRCIGKGWSSANTFMAAMNLPPAPTKFQLYTKILLGVIKEKCHESMKQSVIEAIQENEGSRDLTVTFDGTWQKRGHTSLNGAITAISGENDKIIDVEILSKFCKCKGRQKNVHSQHCQANYKGTSGGMEVEGVKKIFLRSEERYGVRYINYLGDGDSKGFQAACREKPYGPLVEIKKIECVGHVQKRMGSRLRAIKKSNIKASDGKTLGGRGRLTDAAIGMIQTYYGLAIRRNVKTDVAKMRKAVWATYLHLISTDQTPNHNFCPKDEGSWCKYWKAKNKNLEYKHSEHFHLDPPIMTAIKPIFATLSHPDLLSKCLDGKTQNSNESFNNVLWAIIPKRVFVTLPTLEFGTYEAVLLFNRGNISRCDVLHTLGIDPGQFSIDAFRQMDLRRIKKGNIAALESSRERRVKRSQAAKKLEDFFEEEEGDSPSYDAGSY